MPTESTQAQRSRPPTSAAEAEAAYLRTTQWQRCLPPGCVTPGAGRRGYQLQPWRGAPLLPRVLASGCTWDRLGPQASLARAAVGWPAFVVVLRATPPVDFYFAWCRGRAQPGAGQRGLLLSPGPACSSSGLPSASPRLTSRHLPSTCAHLALGRAAVAG